VAVMMMTHTSPVVLLYVMVRGMVGVMVVAIVVVGMMDVEY